MAFDLKNKQLATPNIDTTEFMTSTNRNVSFPQNAVLDANGLPDRTYNALDFANFWQSFFTNGVFPNPSTNLQVFSDGLLSIGVRAGKGFINGHHKIYVENTFFDIPRGNPSLRRIDSVVLQLNTVERDMILVYKTGQSLQNPIVPPLQRDSDIWEIQLAQITVNAGVTEITQSNITDTRLSTELCGLVTGAVESVDTETLWIQMETWFNEQKAIWEKELNDLQEWFYLIRNELTALTYFDFDNNFELPFTRKNTRITTEGGTTKVSSEVRSKVANVLIATKSIVTNGTLINTITKVFDENGEVLRDSETVTNIIAGNISSETTGSGFLVN